MDDLGVDPNCPACLERMTLVVGGWWCDSCRVAVRVNDEAPPNPTRNA